MSFLSHDNLRQRSVAWSVQRDIIFILYCALNIFTSTGLAKEYTINARSGTDSTMEKWKFAWSPVGRITVFRHGIEKNGLE